MAQQVVTTYTVVDENSRGRQMGFRNTFESNGEELVIIRIDGQDTYTMGKEDFKKFLLAGEKLADLLAADEEARGNENENA